MKNTLQFLKKPFKIRTRHLEETLLEKSKRSKPKLDVKNNPELEKQIRIIGLTEEDLAVAQVLQPLVQEHAGKIITHFYKNLEHSPKLINIIHDHSSVKRLQETLRIHMIEMFAGVIDRKFIGKRTKIAHVHVHIGLTQKWYIASFQDLLLSMLDIFEEHIENKTDLLLAIRVLTKLLNLEQQVVLEAYDTEVLRQKEAEIQLKKEVKATVEKTTSELATLARQTNASIEDMTAQIDEITNQSEKSSQTAQEAQKRAQDGKTQLNVLKADFQQVQESTTKIVNDIQGLEEISGQIQEIVEIVQSVAERTNMLSLNAGIEAARAGEHGRGFAVVAEEVGKLAVQTSQSVTHVTDLIAQIKEQINMSSKSIKEVNAYMEESSHHMQTTDTSFMSILKAMDEARALNIEIEQELVTFEQLIQEIAGASETISSSTDELKNFTEKL